MRFLSFKLWVGTLPVLIMGLSASTARADFSVSLGTIFENKDNATLPGDSPLLTFTQNGNYVDLKIENRYSGSNANVIDYVCLNFLGSGNVTLGGLSIDSSVLSPGSQNVGTELKIDSDKTKVPGDGGLFDLKIDFTVQGAGGHLDAGETAIIRLQNSGGTLDADMFKQLSVLEKGGKNQFYGAAHVISIGPNTYSASVGGGTVGDTAEGPLPAPAPGGIVLLASMVPFGVLLRKRSRREVATQE